MPEQPALPRPLLLAALGLVVALGPVLPSRPPSAGAAAQQVSPRMWTRVEVRPAGYEPATLLDPRGVARGPGGRFYVADAGHHRVAVIDASGALVAAFGEPGDGPSGLDSPVDVAVDASRDRVYVADYGNRRVAVFTLAGAPVARWRRASLDHAFAPSAVAAAGGSGHVYVVNRVIGGRVEQFDSAGTWLAGWGGPGSDPGQFNAPEDLTVDGTGQVLVADSSNGRIQVFSADGAHQASWAGLVGARDVATDPATGNAYVLLGGDRVQVLLPDGTRSTVIEAGTLGSDFSPASRIAIGLDGRLAVTTGAGSADGSQGLRQYGLDLALAASTLADPLAHPGFVKPEALTVAANGDLLVLDGPTAVTSRYSPDGALLGRLLEGNGVEIAAAADGSLHVADAWGRVRSLGAGGAVIGERTSEGFVGLGVAAGAGELYVTEALTRAIGVLPRSSAAVEPHERLRIADPPYAWPVDVALGVDGRLYAAGGDNGRVDVIDPRTHATTYWTSGGSGVERIDAAPDGTVFTLRYDGSLAAFSPEGAIESEWWPEPADPARGFSPSDLAAGPNGRLYLLDGVTGGIHVYDAAPASPPTATPESTPVSPCTVTGDKTAVPAAVELGAEVTLRLNLDIQCPAGSLPRADVVLVMDRSNSMAGLKLADAKSAAELFVSGLDLARHRVGLVTFSDAAALDAPLTTDGNAVRAAIRAVQAHGTTNIAAALERADRHIREDGRPGGLGVIVLLTDGEPTGSRQAYVDTVRRAAGARAEGVLLYAIGLGVNVDEQLLEALAGGPERYFFAPEAADLARIYQQLSEAVGLVVASDVQVYDDLAAGLELVPGSPSGRATVTGKRISWALGAVPSGGLPELSLRVVPLTTGRMPTNVRAVAQYTAGSARYTYVFPVPEIEVFAPYTPTPTPTITPTPTPRPTTGPSVAYLPSLARPPLCPPDRRKPADIMLIVDTSSSMTGDKMTAAVEAAGRFLALVSPARDRVGLVGFNSDTRTVPLTHDLAGIERALATLTVAEGTRIDLGLYEATRELYDEGRSEASLVAVLLSDGQPQGGTRDSALEQATLMRTYGITLFAIGMGTDSDADLLRQMAASPQHYYYAPRASQLDEIYERIAVRLPCD